MTEASNNIESINQLELKSMVSKVDDNKIMLVGEISEVCSIWQIRRNFLVLMYLLSMNSFCFFLINFQMKFVKGSLIKNTLGSQIAEFSADALSGVVYAGVGPRRGFVCSYIVGICGSVLMLTFWENKDYILFLIIAAKLGMSSAFNMSFIASIQLIPPIFAASVFGYCNVLARIVTMGSSVIAEMDYPAPLIITICFASSAALASIFLLEKMPKFV